MVSKFFRKATLASAQDVGKFIALGGGASHLEEAVSRIEKLKKHPDHPAHLSIMNLESKKKVVKKAKVTRRSSTKQKTSSRKS